VSFQGALGYLLYSLGRPGYAASVTFAVGAMLESALQKLLMLVLFFGEPLQAAVDGWGAWVVKRYFSSYAGADVSLTWILVGGYVGIYLIGGIAIGIFAARVSRTVDRALEAPPTFPNLQAAVSAESAPTVRKPSRRARRKRRRMLWWLLVALVLGASVYFQSDANGAALSAGLYLARTLAIVAVWYFLVAPFLARQFRRWLLGRQGRYSSELDAVMDAAPLLRQIARQEYASLSRSYAGFGLFRHWLVRVLVLSLTVEVGVDADEFEPTTIRPHVP